MARRADSKEIIKPFVIKAFVGFVVRMFNGELLAAFADALGPMPHGPAFCFPLFAFQIQSIFFGHIPPVVGTTDIYALTQNNSS